MTVAFKVPTDMIARNTAKSIIKRNAIEEETITRDDGSTYTIKRYRAPVAVNAWILSDADNWA